MNAKRSFSLAALAFSLSCCVGGFAAVRLPKVLSDGMVLQRGEEARIWGWADASERVTVTFRGKAFEAIADERGEWAVGIEPRAAGGPFELQVEGENRIVLQDVLVGDLWLTSGQSNMELTMERVKERFPEEVSAANNDRIRYFKVPTSYDFKQERNDVQSGSWIKAEPDSILDFSAVGYFFAREIEREKGVPIGIVNSSVGGSRIQCWFSEAMLEAYPEELAEAKRWRDDALIERTESSNAAIYSDWDRAAREKDQGLRGETPWYDPDVADRDWPSMTLPTFWDEGGLEPMNGVVWFRKSFEVPAGMAGKSGMLYLGTIVDADETYLNGVKVGATTYQYPPRRYEVPAGLLKEGENVIAIRAFSHSGRGSFTRDKPFDLVVDDATIDLRGDWKYKVGAVLYERPGTVFIRWKPMGLYNAMIAPLVPLDLKGVLWYQGESNAWTPDNYQELLNQLVGGWREQWGRADLPFVWAQLPNFMESREEPGESAWARLREQQRLALELEHTGMAVTIDAGEWNDIHPLDKETVGKRLALEARRVAYGETELVSSGPLIDSAERRGRQVALSFRNVGGGLRANGGELMEFAIAGGDGNFVWADARIAGDEIMVWSDAVPEPTRVRYAWADNPEHANLYNAEGLPASPFEIEVE
ncbi:sialate O-acetylesterase [Pelagicoccus sp. NFK12]|uniref:Sialate O-acetylesterase n=1 Tax=Pelagicoccus enzymogenes TaxID=2773457 RepID=A0A927IG72_9BACT|nr:sialate O-acetylesterase [Pelagicoccus enzymogenes]MBD5778080.1 sialate O-acetylesterase [Pelagicoccus enzymogenes]